MQVTIQFSTDTEAFDNNPYEFDDVMSVVKEAIVGGMTEGSIKDHNGKLIGGFFVEE